jgi:hypothetical protein
MESQLLYKQYTNGDGDSEAFQQDPRAPMSASCFCCCCTRDPLAASCSPCLESGLLKSATKFLQIFWKSTKFKQQTGTKTKLVEFFFKSAQRENDQDREFVEEFDHTNFPYDFIEANCARTLRREDDATTRRDETRETGRETKC